ncbi:MAG: thiol peroxidase, partial [Nitrospinae bacterium]|nr:thiol peroxidase [Nitrospinota bacterium]
MSERTVTLKGNPFNLVGPELEVGSAAPDFTVVGGDLSTA